MQRPGELISHRSELQTTVPVELTNKPPHDYRGVSELVADAVRYKRLSPEVNPVTQLPGSVIFNYKLDRFVTREAHKENPTASLGLAIADVDGLKRANLISWKTGDDYLRLTARTLEKLVRPSDHIFHFGGDEFAIVFDGISEEPIDTMSNRIETETERVLQAQIQSEIFPGIAIGAVMYESGESASDFFHHAMEAENNRKKEKTNSIQHLLPPDERIILG